MAHDIFDLYCLLDFSHHQNIEIMFILIICFVCVTNREVKDRDEINEFLRKEIRLGDMRAKVEQELATPRPPDVAAKRSTKVDVILQREQTIQELEKLLEEVRGQKDEACTQLE